MGANRLHPSHQIRHLVVACERALDTAARGRTQLLPARKPVIGSRAGGVVEMVVEGETGFTFPPGDHTMLATQLCALLADPDRSAAMGERGYQRLISDFTLERYMTNFMQPMARP